MPAWSDCNRAIGRIYRVEDLAVQARGREPGDSITIYVRTEDEAWFTKKFGDD